MIVGGGPESQVQAIFFVWTLAMAMLFPPRLMPLCALGAMASYAVGSLPFVARRTGSTRPPARPRGRAHPCLDRIGHLLALGLLPSATGTHRQALRGAPLAARRCAQRRGSRPPQALAEPPRRGAADAPGSRSGPRRGRPSGDRGQLGRAREGFAAPSASCARRSAACIRRRSSTAVWPEASMPSSSGLPPAAASSSTCGSIPSRGGPRRPGRLARPRADHERRQARRGVRLEVTVVRDGRRLVARSPTTAAAWIQPAIGPRGGSHRPRLGAGARRGSRRQAAARLLAADR